MSTVGNVSANTPIWSTNQTNDVKRQNRSSTGNAPPPPVDDGGSGQPQIVGSRPILEPGSADASTMLNAFLAIKTQDDNDQVQDSLNDVRASGKEKHEQNLATAEQMKAATEQHEKAKKNDLAMKILGWVAVALTVVAAVAISIVSLGTATAVAALACAAVVVTMAALTESGQMDKWQGQIADDLQKDHPDWSPQKCQQWATGIMIGIQVTVTIATIATGAGVAKLASVGADAARIAASVARIGTMATNAARVTSTAAGIGGAAVTVAQSGMAMDSGVKAHEATMMDATVLEMKKFIAKLANQESDEEDRLQQLVQGEAKLWSRMTDICKNAEQSIMATLGAQQQSQQTA